MNRPIRFLISSGPTREPLDPVRFISNYSTGYLGRCLATEALRRGHRVTLVSGPTSFTPPRGARVLWVEQAHQMRHALRQQMPKADVLIMAAAVSDFRPVRPRRQKLARRGRRTLALTATPDIVGTLPRRRGQLLVGFALETARGIEQTRAKLRAKRLDLIVGQTMNGTSPFGANRINGFLLDPTDRLRQLGSLSKPRLARILLDEIEGLWYGGERQTEEATTTC